MSDKTVTVEMQYPVTNNFVRNISNSCCRWGQRKPPYDSDGQVKGIFINYKVRLLLCGSIQVYFFTEFFLF